MNALPPQPTDLAKDSRRDLLRATSVFAIEDPRRSWTLTLTSILYLGVAFRLTWIDLPLAVRIPASLLAALLMVRIFVIFHDYEHGAILRNSRLAKYLMATVGILFLRSSAEWRQTHNFHHRHNTRFSTSSTGSFPTKTTDDWAAMNARERRAYRIVRSSWVIVFAYVTCYLLEAAKKVRCRAGLLRAEAVLVLVVHAAIVWAVQRSGWSALALSVMVPYALACAIGVYLFYVQHNFVGAQFKSESEWESGFAALHSSSCLRCSRLAHWFTGNIGYHHAHHLNHRIPFYRLPEAMRALPELQTPIFVSLSPLSTYRNLRLKLWDPHRLRMVGFHEV